ncbi:MAG: UDP-N-acetylmuramate--L-alanine ligase, partial [Chitinophagaceae bacterium]
RSEVLGLISKDSFCIAVAGTHGKTTTSAMIAHILTDTGYGCSAFLGGILTNYGSNFLVGSNNVVVVEADEYDRSFLTLHPDIAVITSMDADHLDIYGDGASLEEAFTLFSKQVKAGGTLIRQDSLPLTTGETYSATDQESMYRSDNIRVDGSAFMFSYVSSGQRIDDIRLKLPGTHNVENAVAAIAVALKVGIDPEKIKMALETFKGVKRRFEIVLESPEHVVIDDYAHHPQELQACFNAVRMLYPNKKMTVVFQPHLYSRTRDFADQFAVVLAEADKLLLMDIYPARELPIEGIDSSFLLSKINNVTAEICGKEMLRARISALDPELLLFVGAGDIDTMVQPAKKILENAE